MSERPRVILIAGPGGAGKTTTAMRIAEHPQWEHVCEDAFWVAVKTGREGEMRTAEEQETVWPRVLDQVQAFLDMGRNVVLEFILYETPPRPLVAYRQALAERGVPFATRILAPDADTVLERMAARGRPGEADLASARRIVELQLGELAPPHIDPAWRMDTSALSVEEVYERHFRPLVEGSASLISGRRTAPAARSPRLRSWPPAARQGGRDTP